MRPSSASIWTMIFLMSFLIGAAGFAQETEGMEIVAPPAAPEAPAMEAPVAVPAAAPAPDAAPAEGGEMEDAAAADAATTETVEAAPPPPPPFDPIAAEAAAMSALEKTDDITTPGMTLAELIDIKTRRRAIWIDMIGETYNTEENIDRIISNIQKAGFNAAYLIVMRGGSTMYPSLYLPVAPAVQPDLPDPVQAFLDAAAAATPPLEVALTALPLEAYAGRDISAAPSSNVLRIHESWTLLHEGGFGAQPGNIYSLDPSIPAVQDYVVGLLRELVDRYPDAASIQLHGMRYPGVDSDWGYSPEVVAAFNDEKETTGEPSPEDQTWQGWRRDQLSKLVERISNAIKDDSPNTKVSITAAAIEQPPVDLVTWRDTATYAGALQDWVSWCDNAVVDEIIVLNFQSEQFDQGYFDGWNKFASQQHKDTGLMIGLGEAENFAEEVLGQIRRALITPGNRGVALYSYQEPNIENIRTTLFQTLGRRIFNEGYAGLRRSNINVDPQFADRLARPETPGAYRSRSDIDIPDVFSQTPKLPEDENAMEDDSKANDSQPAEKKTESVETAALLLPDVIYLKQGGILRGRVTSETAASIRFQDEAGFELTIDRDNIQEIRRAKR